MSIKLKEVIDKKELKAFIDFPHDLYSGDPYYVPQLYVAAEEILNKKKNAFFKHSEARLWLAYRDGVIVGRIAGVLNNEYNAFHKSNVGFFGFFDSINDSEVATALFEKAESYLHEKGVDSILGPTNFTTNDTSGLLVDGFNEPPVVEMTYNFPYYQQLIEENGYGKEMDLFAYFIPTATANEKSIRLSSRIEERLAKKGITFRNLNKKKFNSEVNIIKELYQDAWEKNWGFVPPTKDEFDQLAEGLKLIINPKYTYIAEHDGKVVGFALALPDINEILIDVKKGRLFPTGIFKLLLGKNKTKVVRITLLGVIEAYRNMGIEAVFFAKFILQAKADNLKGGEASWILENNEMMVRAAEKLNGEKYKTYRIFSKKV